MSCCGPNEEGTRDRKAVRSGSSVVVRSGHGRVWNWLHGLGLVGETVVRSTKWEYPTVGVDGPWSGPVRSQVRPRSARGTYGPMFSGWDRVQVRDIGWSGLRRELDPGHPAGPLPSGSRVLMSAAYVRVTRALSSVSDLHVTSGDRGMIRAREYASVKVEGREAV